MIILYLGVCTCASEMLEMFCYFVLLAFSKTLYGVCCLNNKQSKTFVVIANIGPRIKSISPPGGRQWYIIKSLPYFFLVSHSCHRPAEVVMVIS